LFLDSKTVTSKPTEQYFQEENQMSEHKVAEDGIAVNLLLDAKGLSCPMPLLRTKKEIGKIAAGEVLQIDGTDPGSRNDIPGWCTRAGHEYLGEKEESGYISFFIKKG
jgi:tRNA 2-thiouridine synthesizing protein A